MKNTGFTLIELLIVLAIMAALLGLSISGVNQLRENQYIITNAQSVLSSLQTTRSYAINARADSLDSNWIYAYVYFLNSNFGAHGYCTDKWYDPDNTSISTSVNFAFPGTLSQLLANGGSGISINPANIQCLGSANPNGGLGFIAIDNKTYDNRSDISYNFYPSNVAYVAFENLTGNVFFFDKSGNYINLAGVNNTGLPQNCSQKCANNAVCLEISDKQNNCKLIDISDQNGSPMRIQ